MNRYPTLKEYERGFDEGIRVFFINSGIDLVLNDKKRFSFFNAGTSLHDMVMEHDVQIEFV